MPDAARTLGGTPVDETPADAPPVGMAAPPPPPPAETVADGVGGAGGVGDRGKSEPNAARFCGGGGAIIGPGDACDAAGVGGGVWLRMGALGAAGGGAEAGMEAGLTSVTAGGGVGV